MINAVKYLQTVDTRLSLSFFLYIYISRPGGKLHACACNMGEGVVQRSVGWKLGEAQLMELHRQQAPNDN